ncbi:hypothetical protein BDY21DRAFT_334873 [Lineolata rhizophorae]|uniref:Uncharacterized protein n=1 Tax=Lineolata rhizophorae TaxID=578093 RepID=A0A6A6PA09_9PEZI|nr:hypothetical protein BDY21DRAFT_334873 [Lineolata rhizophorae]
MPKRKRKHAGAGNGQAQDDGRQGEGGGRSGAGIILKPTSQHAAIAIPELVSDNDSESREIYEYMQSVRQEVQGLPGLVVAPKNAKGADDDSEVVMYGMATSPNDLDAIRTGGYFSNGAYIATPFIGPIRRTSRDITRQTVWRTYMLRLYDKKKSVLRADPPHAKVLALEPSQLISLPRVKFGTSPSASAARAARREWCNILVNRSPVPAQVACMEKITVLGLVDEVRKLLLRDQALSKPLALWAFALLCRMPPINELMNPEVATLRDLAKVAIKLTIKLASRLNKPGPALGETQASDGKTKVDRSPSTHEQSWVEVVSSPSGTLNGRDETETVAEDLQEEPTSKRLKLDTEAEPAVKAEHPVEQVEVKEESAHLTASGPEAYPNPQSELEARRAQLLARIESIPTREDSNELSTSPTPAAVAPAPAARADAGEATHLDGLAALDMIVTIIGERYGQRDLLEERENWSEEDRPS